VLTTPPCWICGAAGESGEHIVKRSDLKSLVGVPTQSDPIYLHTKKRTNRPIGSLDARALKSPAKLCRECNNARTQPHDLAWQHLFDWLQSRDGQLIAGTYIRANSIFPYDTRRAMRHVQLYFVKLFGLKVVEGNIPLDISSLGDAILRDRLHPNVYLAFGPISIAERGRVVAGASDVQVANLNGRTAFAAWIHHVGGIWVEVMFALDGEKRQGLHGAWHPRFGGQRLLMRKF
jgi:hypothetical protein